MRLSRARVREFLSDWLGLQLSTATINQCIHEAGRAVEPVVEEEIREAVRNVELLYADETSWKEHGRLLWLWVFTCATATLFIVGRRSRAIVRHVLGDTFRNWLMSDGYWAYRDVNQRLRCLAHLLRKAHGLEDSLDREAQRFGTHILHVIETVIEAVYQARGAPPGGGLRESHAPMLNDLLGDCLRQADSRHEKTRALARELLNDCGRKGARLNKLKTFSEVVRSAALRRLNPPRYASEACLAYATPASGWSQPRSPGRNGRSRSADLD